MQSRRYRAAVAWLGGYFAAKGGEIPDASPLIKLVADVFDKSKMRVADDVDAYMTSRRAERAS